MEMNFYDVMCYLTWGFLVGVVIITVLAFVYRIGKACSDGWKDGLEQNHEKIEELRKDKDKIDWVTRKALKL